MTIQELKEAYYQLAVAELNIKFNTNKVGRPFNKEKWLTLAKLICLDEVTLYEACRIAGINYVYQHKLRFIGCRAANDTSKQGNRARKSYTLGEKLTILSELSNKTYKEVTEEYGVTYPTLAKWVLQRDAGKIK